MEKKTSKLLIIGLFITFFLSACSNTKTTENTAKEVQLGSVVAVNKRIIQPEKHKPRGNVGVSVGSGGHSGIYGSMDVVSIGRLFTKPKPKTVFEIIVKRNNGETVSITQPASVLFKRGDRIKIVQREGKARVIH